MKFFIIDDEQLLEGTIGAIFMPLFLVFFRNEKFISFIYGSIFAFFLTWLFRKIALNNYIKYKEKHYYKKTFIEFNI